MFKTVSIKAKLFKAYLKGIKHPSKVRIQNLVGKVLFPKGLVLHNEQGVSFRLDANDWITRTLIQEGDYEAKSTKLSRKILEKGGWFVDIGANFGLFTCISAHKNNKVRVLAIEPNYKVIPRLLNNIRINMLEGNVKIINAAVSKASHILTLEQAASNNLGTTTTRVDINGFLSVLSCSLEFILEEFKVTDIELLKLDVEGNEFDILEEFPFNKFQVKNIILEFNNLSKISFPNLISFFEKRGFKSYSVSGEQLLNDENGIEEDNILFINQNNLIDN